MSYLLPHLHSGFAVDQAILSVSSSAHRNAQIGPQALASGSICSLRLPAGGGPGGDHPLRP